MKILYVLAAALLISPPAVAQTSEDYVMMGAKAYSVWSCSILAATVTTINDPEENRLFTLGYELGKTFLEAVRAGKVKDEDRHKHPPTMFIDYLPGPSTDFVLGQLYAEAIKETLDALKDPLEESRKSKAASMYRTQNCSFLK